MRQKSKPIREDNHRKLLELGRRLPFTFLMLIGLTIGGWITQTHSGQLSSSWLRRVGFAPRDLWAGRLSRLFTSAMVTQGGWVFWQALGLTAFAVGLSEKWTSTRRAILTFWGVHLFSLAVQSWLVAWPLKRLDKTRSRALLQARDVGPSAGYFACLGLAVARLPHLWRAWAGSLILSGLGIACLLPVKQGEVGAAQTSSNLVHLIAFPIGLLSNWISPLRDMPGLGARE
jgi:hypothetical protein